MLKALAIYLLRLFLRYIVLSSEVQRSREIFEGNILERGGYVYIMTNYQRSTLYIGVTSDLRSRIYEHQNKIYPESFTAKYNLTICIYYEAFYAIEEAIGREEQLKRWNRSKKEYLISLLNKDWKDLSHEILQW